MEVCGCVLIGGWSEEVEVSKEHVKHKVKSDYQVSIWKDGQAG